MHFFVHQELLYEYATELVTGVEPATHRLQGELCFAKSFANALPVELHQHIWWQGQDSNLPISTL
jgi:hypothetical protein